MVIDRFLNGESVKYKKPFRVERELPSDYFARFEKAKRQTADVYLHSRGKTALRKSLEDLPRSRPKPRRCAALNAVAMISLIVSL